MLQYNIFNFFMQITCFIFILIYYFKLILIILIIAQLHLNKWKVEAVILLQCFILRHCIISLHYIIHYSQHINIKP